MGLFDFFSQKQAEAEKLTDPERLKLDTETSTRVKKRLTSLEGTVKEMKAHEAKLKQELQQAEAIKYGKEEKPDYTGKGFEAFLSTVTAYSKGKAEAKPLEQVRTEMAEFERYKGQFLTEKLREIEADLHKLKSQQTAKLREIESALETADNTAEIDEIYKVIVADYQSLNVRTGAIAAYCPRKWYSTAYERIEREGLAGRDARQRKQGKIDAQYAANYMAAHSGGKQ
ncbi:hypothetical protein UAS_00700 [Enterococcus asini ATCC 700915]|uniref:Uncharacterized protein n=1 Tax=Enterococcus asini ATCC 700915 TaxID=1158606 RepID=R2S8I8_9ENTE|nr:hypothetical protein [Enterococcus asini]EOH89161.1 hypothetical protein UAS_00700 [Enterococcus asini ATCC 700915]EOT55732.1 hypothetical protein I579_02095 [Enterococcus asini ATCC 700915]OJG13054.1 hypothetical protein RU94_GL001753 [Enterococcus asini]